MIEINAPGQDPSPDYVQETARKCLSLDDEPDTPTPPFILEPMTDFLKQYPGNDNFLLELGNPHSRNTGGNGFGVVTCMENGCWNDVILEADPNRPAGGRPDGLGSFHAYAEHCQEDTHRHWRDQRLQQLGITVAQSFDPASDQSHSAASSYQRAYQLEAGPSRMPGSFEGSSVGPSAGVGAIHPVAAFANDEVQPQAGPSRLGPVSWGTQSSDTKQFNKFGPSPFSAPVAPTNSLSSKVSSWLDDDIVCTGETPKLAARKEWKELRTEGAPVISLLDSDSDDAPGNSDDIKPIPSQQGGALSSTQTGARPSQMDVKPNSKPWIAAWNGLSYVEKRAAASQERQRTRILYKSVKANLLPEQCRVIKRRLEELSHLERACMLLAWSPPKDVVFRALGADLGIHERLRGTFPIPDGVLAQPPASPASTALTVGNGTIVPAQPTQHGAAAAVPTNTLAATPGSVISAVWNSLSHTQRLSCLSLELGALVDWLRTTPSYSPGPRDSIHSRMMAVQAMFRTQVSTNAAQAWTPPNSQVVTAIPSILNSFPIALRNWVSRPTAPNLPVVPPSDIMDEWHDHQYEWDRPKDLPSFLQDAMNEFEQDATVEEALRTLGLENLKDKLPGANFSLMPHQVIGVAFMAKRERSKKVSGGMLCDAMGLGKTVQTISLMLVNHKRPDDFKKAPQLIVAPVALLEQWKSEILTKTDKQFSVCIHHGQGRTKSHATLSTFDIVLTSYGTLSSESGLDTKAERKKKRNERGAGADESDDDSDFAPNRKKEGPLFKVKWFRVILDEAHTVRNRTTRTAKSVLKLDPLHAWCLTGSPVVNTLSDLGVMMRFIGATDQEDFHHRIGRVEKKRPKLAAKRAQAMLRPIMLRRNKETEINGKRILDLPPKTTVMTPLAFTPEERAIYNAIENQARIRVNKFLKAGTLMKQYHVVLVLLTRLRQAVNHPWLLRREPEEGQLFGDEVVVDDDGTTNPVRYTHPNDAEEYKRAVLLVGKDKVNKMHDKLKERFEAVSASDDDQAVPDVECSICYEPFSGDELITPCLHVFCGGCLDNLFTLPLRDGTDLSDDQVHRGCRLCPLCRCVMDKGSAIRAKAIFKPPQQDAPEDEGSSDRKGKKRACPSSPGGHDDKKPRLDLSEANDDEKADDGAEEVIPPSTKMLRMLELVQGWLQEDPKVKILVFSQFVQFLDLLNDFFTSNGVRCLNYRGSMSQPQREEALRRYAAPAELSGTIPVMLISTKAGGVGLNLTMASKVICADLAWNPATENQAVDRTHRIGQTRPVQVERLVIQDTVEDRLLEIQKRKGLLADGAMGEGEIGRLGRLNQQDIINLFAINREYERNDD